MDGIGVDRRKLWYIYLELLSQNARQVHRTIDKGANGRNNLIPGELLFHLHFVDEELAKVAKSAREVWIGHTGINAATKFSCS